MKKKQSNKEKFLEWLKKVNNIYLADNQQMSNAFEKIIEWE
jgi:hypothetical protein